MSKYQEYKAKFTEIFNFRNSQHPDVIIDDLEKLSLEMLSTIQELEPVEIDPEFFNWQSRKYNLYPLSTKLREVYKEKSDGTRVRVGLLYNDDDLALYKPKSLKSPTDNPNYCEGLNWSIYWFYLNDEGKRVKFQPSNRINEVFEDPWSTYEFNALGYKTPNGTIVHYDSYLEE